MAASSTGVVAVAGAVSATVRATIIAATIVNRNFMSNLLSRGGGFIGILAL